jgi:hypothetical protein
VLGDAPPLFAFLSKAYEDGFRFKQNPPRFLYAALDFTLQTDYVARLRVSAVDQG